MKQTKKNTKIFLFIFLVAVIPTIYVYFEHGIIEHKAFEKATSETKKTKTFAEAVFFYAIGIGYVILTLIILIKPNNKIPYLVLIIGTIGIVVFYYISRIYPIPIPFTEITIFDKTSDWRDVVTKIAQQIMVIPLSLLLVKINNKRYDT